jgi:uncharacterized protein DUF4199
MEDQQKPTNKTALYYGVILGIVLILANVIVYALGMIYDQDWKTGSIGLIAMIAVLFIGIKKYKEINDSYLTVGQAIKTGLGIAVIGGIISVIYTFIFMNYIEPDFVTNTLAVAEEKMIEQNPNLTDEQIEQALSISKKFMSPMIMSAMALIWTLFLGFIISLISGLILKKNQDQ